MYVFACTHACISPCFCQCLCRPCMALRMLHVACCWLAGWTDGWMSVCHCVSVFIFPARRQPRPVSMHRRHGFRKSSGGGGGCEATPFVFAPAYVTLRMYVCTNYTAPFPRRPISMKLLSDRWSDAKH
ncbi:hypothetical protein IWX49DRAFT_581226 [Phyllosticta citricarpa]|uniref:Secreted protein n=1 Tax=Phyllosticta citricarpa TaxID=55181 RepID=A0ABR1L3A6_9PEZI